MMIFHGNILSPPFNSRIFQLATFDCQRVIGSKWNKNNYFDST